MQRFCFLSLVSNYFNYSGVCYAIAIIIVVFVQTVLLFKGKLFSPFAFDKHLFNFSLTLKIIRRL